MQLNRKNLIEELSWIQKFIGKKVTIPILGHALFSVDGTKLTLTATNLEVGGITTVTGNGRQQWKVTAPIAKLIKYLGKVEEEEVTLGRSEKHELVVTHGYNASCLKILGMSSESFPELPAFPEEAITLRGLPLAVERTAWCISKEESRFTLNGALLEIEKGEAHLIATDGHRLSRAPLTAKGVDELRVLIPKAPLLEAAKLDGDCRFAVNEDHAFLDWGQRKIVTRKLTGNFPDWRRIMADEFPNHAMLPRATTLKTLERVALYADERSHAVRFFLADGKLTLRAESIEQGSTEGVVPTTGGVIERPLDTGLNASYLTEYLSRTDAQFVALCWSNPPINEDGTPKPNKDAVQFVLDGYQYVVMPMRV